MTILGIDPGQAGSIVALFGNQSNLDIELMPLKPNKDIDFKKVKEILESYSELYEEIHIFLERALPMAMGSKHAFNYGRGFAAIEIAIEELEIPVTYVEPAKWAKLMHDGINTKYKTKEKSAIAFKRLFPKLVPKIPKSKKGRLHEGVVEATLIAAYGQRILLK